MAEQRIPPKITPSYLENAALYYLQRYSAPIAQLRRVLRGKVDRSIAHWGGDIAEHAAQIEALIVKLTDLGYLNDSAYAESKTRALHRQGKGGRAIRAALAAKGLSQDMTEQALIDLAAETPQPDLDAAVRLARKRRLGPFRTTGSRTDFRQKDLAALARSGFDFDTARMVIDAADEDALATLMDD